MRLTPYSNGDCVATLPEGLSSRTDVMDLKADLSLRSRQGFLAEPDCLRRTLGSRFDAAQRDRSLISGIQPRSQTGTRVVRFQIQPAKECIQDFRSQKRVCLLLAVSYLSLRTE